MRKSTRESLRTLLSILILVALFACGKGESDGSSGAAVRFLLAANSGGQWYSSDASVPSKWISTIGIPGSAHTRGVAFGNGLFVWSGGNNVSNVGRTFTTTNAANPNYTITDLGSFTTPYEIVFANGKFVIIGVQSNVSVSWTSTDGVSWSQHTIAGHGFSSNLTHGQNLFVADCLNTSTLKDDVCYSTNGENWTSVALTSADFINDVSYGNGLFVAVGRNSSGTPYFWSSADGINWSAPAPIGIPVGNFFAIGGVAYGNGAWVIAGSNSGVGHFWWSFNGVNWNLNTIGGEELNDVAFLDSSFYAIGEASHILVSTNGIGWLNRDVGMGVFVDLQEIAFIP